MSLVNYLIEGLLPEEKNKKTIGVYGGGFKPPTKGHFEVVKQALDENPEIDEMLIFVGKKERDGITQEESLKIWEIYGKYLPFKVKYIKATKPPIQSIYNVAKENPESEVIWIIGAREGNEQDFSDIASRTAGITKYSNLELRTIVTKGGISGTAARNAAKISPEKLNQFIPNFLSEKEKTDIFVMLNNTVTETVFAEGAFTNIETLEISSIKNSPEDGKAAPYGSGYNEVGEGKKDPKKGTGKKPKGSGRRLYTDENPKDTVSIKFSTRQDIVDTLNKTSFKSKPHARQSQIINLIHQRVRAAYGRAKDPAVKKRLKIGLDYITKRKEASKKKTQRLNKQKTNESVDFISLEKILDNMFEDLGIDINFTRHFKERVIERGLTEEDIIELMEKIYDTYGDEVADLGKDENRVFTHIKRLVDIAAINKGYGEDYLKDLVLKTAYKRNSLREPEFRTNSSSPKLKVNENASYSQNIDVMEKIAQLTNHMINKGKYSVFIFA